MNLKVNCRQKVGNYSHDVVVRLFPCVEFVTINKKVLTALKNKHILLFV